jgi:hypothetical protein
MEMSGELHVPAALPPEREPVQTPKDPFLVNHSTLSTSPTRAILTGAFLK